MRYNKAQKQALAYKLDEACQKIGQLIDQLGDVPETLTLHSLLTELELETLHALETP